MYKKTRGPHKKNEGFALLSKLDNSAMNLT